MPHDHRRSHVAHRHLGDAMNNLEVRQPDVATVVSIVYVTAAKTFSGPAILITDGPVMTKGSPVQTSVDSETTSEAKSHGKASDASTNKHTSTVISSSLDESSTVAPSSASQSSQGNQLLAVSSTLSASAVAATSATATPTPSSGMSGGAKAGLVLGILIAIAVVLALVLLFYHKKKKNMQHQELDNEKGSIDNGVAASIRTARTMSTAPRLSLRPVTQFSPNLANNRKSAGNTLEMAAAPAADSHSDSRGFLTPAAQPSSAWERPGAANNANDPANPFGNHAETVEPASAPMTPEPAPAPTTNTAAKSEMSPLSANPVIEEAPAVAAAVAAPLASPVVRKGVPEPLSPKPDMSVPMAMPSPAWTDDIPASPGPAPTGPPPIAATGGVASGPAPVPNNVHRVQLDFKPSMNDELELRAGELVRMLHEYDDGWALCTRLDRSQRGVVPRTCLSKHPVKPRTGPPRQGPPPGAPNMRGPPMGPGFPQPRPLSPANGRNSPRPMSPAGGRNSPGPYGQPRAMSPAGGRNSPGPYGQQRPMPPAGARGRSNSNAPYAGPPRSMSPGPYGGGPQRPIPPPEGRRRSNSASQVMARRASPPGPSPMNPNPYGAPIPARKPVPGQAL
ncbi:uncharacterized protein K441DRAFT_686067 [Cenococcum geophilum 1.58]|uniref:uncharacterized protein n=1 Tax=Cenococcum geophilum 1.58 TaxID=794803 RepID=UPI00358F51CB|nr:hypothetical protein K441DRAFT_686067 [Cenococcum geophilum 1.58]